MDKKHLQEDGEDPQHCGHLEDSSEQQQVSSFGKPAGLRRQPTKYPHGLDISVQTINDEFYTENYSRASTLRSSNTCNNWKHLPQSPYPLAKAKSLSFPCENSTTPTSAMPPSLATSEPTKSLPSPSSCDSSSSSSSSTCTATANEKKYRISLISSRENFAELQVNRFKYPLSGNYYLDAHDATTKSQLLLMEYAKRYCRWKYMRWPLIFVASVLVFFGLITYCIWLHDVSVARERYLQKRQQWELANNESSEELFSTIIHSSNSFNSFNDATFTTSGATTLETTEQPKLISSEGSLATQQGHKQSTKLNAIELKSERYYTSTTVKAKKLSGTTKQQLQQKQQEQLQEQEQQQRPSFNRDSPLESAHSIRFTSGHQNNFGIPLEEDERILKFLSKLSPTSNPPSFSTINMKTKVSPTIPPIFNGRPTKPMPATKTPVQQDSRCYSTTLEMCRGVLDYDLTYNATVTLNQVEEYAFRELVDSNCSSRAIEFICATLEPECRPKHIGILPPCRRICKAILEACSIVIANSDILTATFDCSLYPDSNDPNKCEDPTRRRGYCYENEFECYDRSCIPYQWQCDNIKDCGTGEDEEGCLECDQEEEFRCRSNEKCIPESSRCDLKYDCFDASDEEDCDDYGSGGGANGDGLLSSKEFDEAALNSFPRIFSYASILLPNQSNEKLYTYITAATEEDESGTKFRVHEVTNRTSGISQEEVTNSVPGDGPNGFVNFRDSKEIMMTSDSENKFKYSRVNRTTTKAVTSTTPLRPFMANKSANTTPTPKSSADCALHELRCISGKCITVQQLCDKIMDCPDGADELMCVYKVRSTTPRSSNATSTTVRSDKQIIRTTLRRKSKT